MNTTNAEFKCPLCGEPMTSYPDDPTNPKKGVRLQCDNPCDPQCHENVYGHGGTEKEAYATAGQKFRKPQS